MIHERPEDSWLKEIIDGRGGDSTSFILSVKLYTFQTTEVKIFLQGSTSDLKAFGKWDSVSCHASPTGVFVATGWIFMQHQLRLEENVLKQEKNAKFA